jgi:hypothetical protein
MDLGQFDPAHGIKVAKVHPFVHRQMGLGRFEPRSRPRHPVHGTKVAKVHPYAQKRMDFGRSIPPTGKHPVHGI